MFLLRQMHVLRIGQSWPLILIFFGVFMLAERAALADEEMYPPMPFPGGPGATAPQGSEPPPTAIVPAREPEYGNGGTHHEGGEQ